MSTITLSLNMTAQDLSHELRIPLTGILGGVELLSDDTLSTDQKERLELIREASTRLLLIIEIILKSSSQADDRTKDITPFLPSPLNTASENTKALTCLIA